MRNSAIQGGEDDGKVGRELGVADQLTTDGGGIEQRVAEFRVVSDVAYRISPLAQYTVPYSDRQFFGRNLFLHIVYVAGAVRQLVEPVRQNEREWWQRHIDVSSVASLVRNLVEAYDLFWYMAIEKCTDEEWEFRQEVWNIHYAVEMKQVRSSLGVPEDTYPDGETFQDVLTEMARNRLRANAEFAKLPERARRRVLSGTRPTMHFKDRLPKWNVIDGDELRGLYKYLSHHTHAHPIAIEARVSLIFERNLLEPRTVLSRALRCSVDHLCLAVLDYLRKFRRFYPLVSAQERDMLKDIIRSTS